MIVLGPMDSDLNGAPAYWRSGNWRPHTLTPGPAGCAFTSIPFDKCDLVFEYDARNEKAPRPEDQGWAHMGPGGGPEQWKHDPTRGTLAFDIKEGGSFWLAADRRETMPTRAVAYATFMVDRSAENPASSGGFDFDVRACPKEGRTRGMRANWNNRFAYRTLDGSGSFPVLQPAAEPSLRRVWHRLALDAELQGPSVEDDDVDRDDGGKTIGSLDDRVNNDDRRRFLYDKPKPLQPEARFGQTEIGGPLTGRIRNFVASYPGRFMRAGFRAAALGRRTRVRFVFCLDPGEEFEAGSAVFRIRYAAPSFGLRPGSLPVREADPTPTIRQFDHTNLHRTVEIPVDLHDLATGEELWFTIERDWRHDGDGLPATVHLLMVILEETGR